MAKAVVIGSGSQAWVASPRWSSRGAGWEVVVFEKRPQPLLQPSAAKGPDRHGVRQRQPGHGGAQLPAEPTRRCSPRTWRPEPGLDCPVHRRQCRRIAAGRRRRDRALGTAKVPRRSGTSISSSSPRCRAGVPGADLADWPFSYAAEIAPFYDEVEQLIGAQGDIQAFPDIVKKLRAPPGRSTRCRSGPQMRSSVAVAAGATAIGLHPVPLPRWRSTRGPTTTSTSATTAGSAARCLAARWWPGLLSRARSCCAGRCVHRAVCGWSRRRWSPRVLLSNSGRGRAGDRRANDPDDRTRPGDRDRDRRRGRDGGVGHRDRPPGASLAVPRPQRQAPGRMRA